MSGVMVLLVPDVGSRVGTVHHEVVHASALEGRWTVPGLVDTGRVALSLKEIHVMGATRRAFTPEYRSQAVGFVLDDDRSIAEVARNIGCHEYTLGKWVKKEREARDRADAERPVGESERVELIRLRAEKKDDTARIAQLEMQVAFAKKVAAWFANEQR